MSLYHLFLEMGNARGRYRSIYSNPALLQEKRVNLLQTSMRMNCMRWSSGLLQYAELNYFERRAEIWPNWNNYFPTLRGKKTHSFQILELILSHSGANCCCLGTAQTKLLTNITICWACCNTAASNNVSWKTNWGTLLCGSVYIFMLRSPAHAQFIQKLFSTCFSMHFLLKNISVTWVSEFWPSRWSYTWVIHPVVVPLTSSCPTHQTCWICLLGWRRCAVFCHRTPTSSSASLSWSRLANGAQVK